MILAPLLVTLALTAPPSSPPIVYRGATVLTGTGVETPDADLVVVDGKFAAIGPRGQVDLPESAQIVDLKDSVIIPGLVDTHSHIGIYPRPSISAHADGNEMTGPAQPGLRALDAIWPADPGIAMARSGGVTTANIMPGSGNAIGGQTLYVKLRPSPTIDGMMIDPGQPTGGLKMANGENPKRAYGGKGEAPVTRMRLAAIQREQFLKALQYKQKWQSYREALKKGDDPDHDETAAKEKPTEPARDLNLECLVEVLERKRTVHFHSHRADDIMTVARLADEFGFEVVLQHGTEAYKVAGELAKRGIGVSMTLADSPGGKAEVLALRDSNPQALVAAGVKLAINTDDFITESRLYLRTAGIAVRGGLSEQDALKALTLNPAQMLHLDHRVGSIEPGKDADFVILSGRPFSVYTHVLRTYIEGNQVYNRASDGNLAIGGFALADPASRPDIPPATRPASPVEAPAGNDQEVPDNDGSIAIRAGLLHVVGRPPITNGIVLIEKGRITRVGPADEVDLPDQTPVLHTAVATPGLIDAYTVVGLSGWLNVAADQDQDETTGPNQADIRVLDGFNPAEPLLRYALEHGVTIAQVCPGRSSAIAGQAAIFRTHGDTAASMLIRSPSAVVFNLGEAPKATGDGKKPPATRMGTAAVIRTALNEARGYQTKKRNAPDGEETELDLKAEALAAVLTGDVPALFTAHRGDDLLTSLRISEEFKLKTMLGLATEGYLIADSILQAGVPVLVHPTMQRIGEPETINSSLANAAMLDGHGIPIAITSGFEGYVPKSRVPIFEAAIAMANGLDADRAIESITLSPARILGIDKTYGSLEPGKAGDVVLYDGDPFEFTSHVTHVLIDGRVVYDRDASLRNPAPTLVPVGAGEPDCCLDLR